MLARASFISYLWGYWGNEHHDWPTSLHIKLALFSLSAEKSHDGWLNVKSIRGH